MPRGLWRNLTLLSLFFLFACNVWRHKQADDNPPQDLHDDCSPHNDTPSPLEVSPEKKKKVVISLGHNCGARWHIQYTYLQDKSMETNLFDWAFSYDFSSIIKVLNINEPESVFKKSEVVILNANIEDNPKHIGAKFLQLSDLRFVHDIERDKGLEEEKEKFVEQTLRRYHRFINNIKKIDVIYFLRWNHKLTKAEVVDFFESLEKIKKGNKHILVHAPIGENGFEFQPDEPYYHRFKVFNMENLRLKPNSNVYWAEEFDWPVIFRWIDAHQ